MTANPRIAALIVAAGRSVRAGSGVPKPYRVIGGMPMLTYSIDAFLHHPAIAAVQVVIHPNHAELYAQAVGARRTETLLPPVAGGAERADSVRAGLEALAPHAPDYVMIHDAARPFLTGAMIDRLAAALCPDRAVLPALAVVDTLRRAVGEGWQEVPRDQLYRMQTPQVFPYAALRTLHAQSNSALTDDAALWLDAKRPLDYVEGEEHLRKMTIASDIAWAEQHGPRRTAIGQGLDVHRLVPAGPAHRIRLGGIDIEYHHRLHGHSDGDVVLHAVTDALLGALGEGDIGMHFPPSDERWRGADSEHFLREAMRLVAARAGIVQHVDITIICEAPKIGPHRDAMRAHLAEIMALPPAHVNVKATTTETLGFTGRGEGIAAQAVATVSLPMDAAV